MFHKAQKMTKAIGKGPADPKLNTADEKQLKTNIQAELARELQDLSINFRTAQKNYLSGRPTHFFFVVYLLFGSALRSRQKKIGQFSDLEFLEPENIDTVSLRLLVLIPTNLCRDSQHNSWRGWMI